MRLIFAGTPEFAAVALSALIAAGHDIALVLTQPDRPSGRGMQLQPSAVKQLAQQHNIPVFQPPSLKNADAQKVIADVHADVMIVAAYGLILPQVVLDLPKRGCLNIHASLLPRWRGAAPIHRAIEAGDSETGITIMQMDAGLDTGAMLLTRKVAIGADETTVSLHDKLAALGGACIVEALTQLDQLAAVAQSQAGVTYAHKIRKEEALINWSESAENIERKIRAFNPYPVAYATLRGEVLRIWRAEVLPAKGKRLQVGEMNNYNNQLLTIGCGEGNLRPQEVQKAGGKRLPIAQFLAGHTLISDEKFDA
jgi:methionyl-tRNA formyltransferase